MISVWYLNLLVLLLQIGDINALVRWPNGNYALLKPETGCPEEWGTNRWEDGWIYQESYNYGINNDRSNALHMAGYLSPKKVMRYFCVIHISTKNKAATSTWPEGKYCIYSKQWQMQGMQRGYIAVNKNWYKNYSASITSIKGFIDVYHRKYNYLYFFCKVSGDKKTPIKLPITKPFYLLPYGSRDCQKVKWMVATSEWIKYPDTRDDYYYSSYDYILPYYETDDHDYGLKIYYCYYKSCNYTLKLKNGSFQSPGFPKKYPDKQLCSWKIMVPANHTVHVSFTHFSLYEYDEDCLRLHKNVSNHFKLKQALFGHQQPFTITATTDVLFVFRSDEENNSTGFRAEYEIAKIPEKTTTAKPPTTTSLTTTKKTTTTQPTTKLKTTKPPTTKRPTTKQPTTKEPATKPCITTETTTFTSTKANVNSTTNDTVLSGPTSTKHESSSYRNVPLLKKTCFCDETWRIVVMVIPLVVFILIVVITIDIVCRCRNKKATKSETRRSIDDEPVVNPTYERGNIPLEQPTDTLTDTSALNTVDDHALSQEPPDYEDVDYTQLNGIPPPNRDTGYSECHVLESLANDAPEVFYHVLEPPADSTRPTYENLSEVNHHTTDPVYEAGQNSGAFVEVNILYDQYIA